MPIVPIMDVFTAVADPKRRAILGALRERGALPLGALAEPFSISRQAVKKHLETLERVGLIVSAMRRRERIHRLRPGPLKAVDDWLTPYAAAWDERLERLRAHLEDPGP